MKPRFEFLFSVVRGLFFRVAGALANFAFFVVLGRALGVAETGTFMLGFGFVIIFSAIGRLGLEQIIVREATPVIIQSNSERLGFLYVNCLFWVVFSSVFLSLILYIFSLVYLLFYVSGGVKYLEFVFWVGLSIPALTIAYIHVPFLQAARKPEASVAILGFWIPFISLILFFMLDAKDASDASKIYFIACFVTAIFSVIQWFFWKSIPIGFNRLFDKIKSKELLSSSFHLLIGNFFLMSIPWIGIYVAGLLLTSSAVGVISVAQRVSMTISGFLMPPVEALIGPRLSDLVKDGIPAMELYCRNISTALTFIVIIVFVLLIFLGKEILKIFGGGFEDGYSLLIILCLGQLVFVACGPTRLVLIYFGSEKFIRNSMFFSAVACTLLCFALIPFLGGIGAAIATSFSISAQKIVEMYFAFKRLGIKTYPRVVF